MRRIEINYNDEGQRLDKFVQKTVWGMPLSLVYKFIRTKKIKVNGKKATVSYRLVAGDFVEMFIPSEFERPTSDKSEYLKVNNSLRIAYEDENIIICDKPIGLLVHAGDEGEQESEMIAERETLLFMIKAYLVQKNEYDPEEENSFSPALCNRIDRNTGGLVIAAKNAQALRFMNEEIKKSGIKKKYLCAIHGIPDSNHEILRGYLKKDSKIKKVSVFDREVPGSKVIVTEYNVVSKDYTRNLALLEVTLHTGRTHQIRAHLAHLGFPLIGDGKYSNNAEDRKLGWDHQALYSYKIVFDTITDYFSYLNGQIVEVDHDVIPFLKLFDSHQ